MRGRFPLLPFLPSLHYVLLAGPTCTCMKKHRCVHDVHVHNKGILEVWSLLVTFLYCHFLLRCGLHEQHAESGYQQLNMVVVTCTVHALSMLHYLTQIVFTIGKVISELVIQTKYYLNTTFLQF